MNSQARARFGRLRLVTDTVLAVPVRVELGPKRRLRRGLPVRQGVRADAAGAELEETRPGNESLNEMQARHVLGLDSPDSDSDSESEVPVAAPARGRREVPVCYDGN